MASSGGTFSGSSSDDTRLAMDQRKRKRMISNRESARRSRMRKQKHLDDLMNQMAQLKRENDQIMETYKITSNQYLAVEAENSVLRTQMVELNTRFQSLNEILGYINGFVCDHTLDVNPWNQQQQMMSVNLPIMASADNNMFFC